MSLAERVLDLLFEYQEIRDGCEADVQTDRPVYLKRYYIVRNIETGQGPYIVQRPRFALTWRRRSNGVQVYLHHILRSDADPEMHDHPWSFLSIILWRGYREETEVDLGASDNLLFRWTDRRVARKWPGMVLFRSSEHRHRVHIVSGPAWTLVFTSGKRRSWGFWRDGSFIPWRNFIARKCEGEEARNG